MKYKEAWEELKEMLKNMEVNGNPFRSTMATTMLNSMKDIETRLTEEPKIKKE
jgi:hypothetical protein